MAKKGQKFQNHTAEFKLKIAEAYLSGKYGGRPRVTRHFGIGQTRIYEWVKIYQEKGPEGFLVDGRGKKDKIGQSKSVKLEEMGLEEQVKYLKMENDILKKIKALLKD